MGSNIRCGSWASAEAVTTLYETSRCTFELSMNPKSAIMEEDHLRITKYEN